MVENVRSNLNRQIEKDRAIESSIQYLNGLSNESLGQKVRDYLGWSQHDSQNLLFWEGFTESDKEGIKWFLSDLVGSIENGL